eukprot:gene3521-7005_t
MLLSVVRFRNLRCISPKTNFLTRIINEPSTHSFIKQRKCSSNVAVNVDQSNTNAIAYWLLGMSGLVAGMVTVGGVTRLTKSGLSMTDWKLQGSLPPITAAEWNAEFERYKLFPEWQQRKNMTVEEFKYIYFWEYGHRMMGRFIGVAFVVPFTYFAVRGRIPRNLYPRLGLLFTLGGAQGLIGWWMVKSGLNVDPNQKKEIRVSPYRLATHLGMAFATYSLLLWTGLDLLNTTTKAKAIATKMSSTCLQNASGLRRFAIANGILVATTVLSGAYVAGNDAGRAYNTYPDMNGEWIPTGILEMTPLWRNFFENTATVQFDHRVLALTTLGSIGVMYHNAKRSVHWSSFPLYTRRAFQAVAGMSIVQVGLGITTLLLYVPIPLAVIHQAGSLTLLTITTALIHSLRFAKVGQSIRIAASTVSTAGSATATSTAVKTAYQIKACEPRSDLFNCRFTKLSSTAVLTPIFKSGYNYSMLSTTNNAYHLIEFKRFILDQATRHDAHSKQLTIIILLPKPRKYVALLITTP